VGCLAPGLPQLSKVASRSMARRFARTNLGVLKEGNEVKFGTCAPQLQNNGLEDYSASLKLI